MLNSQAQIRQAVAELIEAFGDRVPDEVIFEVAAATHAELSRTATVHAHLAVLTARRAARELAFTAIGVTMPQQQTAAVTPAR
ncbi:hypothetical protein OG205_46465 [Lentzea sp. NBC_00516]|uniref:three-helix bundle dimerization domain-containing protein n=1 Tax=Lentzea sp. NBC_00516 TaxID=2903582 RepID=UPI002E802DDE|nr:hypothetical protein [Lentzea sp. NBC_00516]WUD25373.1 hypothetical protein OG205_46465 [Lentzea sp. NBC_00516]